MYCSNKKILAEVDLLHFTQGDYYGSIPTNNKQRFSLHNQSNLRLYVNNPGKENLPPYSIWNPWTWESVGGPVTWIIRPILRDTNNINWDISTWLFDEVPTQNDLARNITLNPGNYELVLLCGGLIPILNYPPTENYIGVKLCIGASATLFSPSDQKSALN